MYLFSMRKLLSRLLFLGGVCFAFFVIFSHFKSSQIDPISWSVAGKTLAWLFGLSVFFKLISPRNRKKYTQQTADFTVDVRHVGSDDVSASPRQIEYIRSLGGKPKKGMSMAEASALIEELKIEREVNRREEVERRLDERRNKLKSRFKTVDQISTRSEAREKPSA